MSTFHILKYFKTAGTAFTDYTLLQKKKKHIMKNIHCTLAISQSTTTGFVQLLECRMWNLSNLHLQSEFRIIAILIFHCMQ